MAGLTFRTKFNLALGASIVLIAALTVTTIHAMNSLDSALDNLAFRIPKRADRSSQLVETVGDLAGSQQALLLRSILSNANGVEQNRPNVANAEIKIETIITELTALFDENADKEVVSQLRDKARSIKPASDEFIQFVTKQSARAFAANRRVRTAVDTRSTKESASASRILALAFVGLTLLSAGARF